MSEFLTAQLLLSIIADMCHQTTVVKNLEINKSSSSDGQQTDIIVQFTDEHNWASWGSTSYSTHYRSVNINDCVKVKRST